MMTIFIVWFGMEVGIWKHWKASTTAIWRRDAENHFAITNRTVKERRAIYEPFRDKMTQAEFQKIHDDLDQEERDAKALFDAKLKALGLD